MIAIMSGTQEEIVERKTALQTAISVAFARAPLHTHAERERKKGEGGGRVGG